MKKFFFYTTLLVWYLLTPSLLSAQERFHMEAQVKNCPSKYAVFYDEEENDTIPIQSDGTLKFDKVMKKPYYVSFIIPKVQMFMGIWAENGKYAYVNVDANNAEGAVLTGSTQKESDFMREELTTMAKWNPIASSFTEYQKAWSLFTDSISQTAQALGNNKFHHYINSYMENQYRNKMTNYYRQLVEKGLQADADVDFNGFMDTQDISAIDNPNDGFLFSYLVWKAQCKQPSKSMDYYAMLQVLADEVIIPTVKDDLAMRLFRMLMTSKQTEHAEEACQLAMGMTTPEAQQYIQSFYLSSSRPACSEIEDFTVLDIKEHSFSFKSVCDRAVVYVDVWSTWCIPCKKEIPFVAKLVERYKGNPNIKFVSLSIDKNRTNWKNFLAKQKDSWEQYLVPDEVQRQFMNTFAINGIPRFMVFDRQGRIININEERPSAENIIEILDRYIRKYTE